MAISKKIKALINLKNKDLEGLANTLGISKQALSNKFYRDSFSADDLIKTAEYLGCDLAFIIDDTQRVVLDKTDVKEKPIK